MYDALGRKLSESDSADNRVTSFTYNTALYGIGAPATETVKVNGTTVYQRLYGYDSAGRARAAPGAARRSMCPLPAGRPAVR